MAKKRRTLPEVEAAIRKVESFVSSLAHACGQDWDDRKVMEMVWEQTWAIFPDLVQVKIMQELGFNVEEKDDEGESVEE